MGPKIVFNATICITKACDPVVTVFSFWDYDFFTQINDFPKS